MRTNCRSVALIVLYGSLTVILAHTQSRKPQQPTNPGTFRVAGMVVSAADGHPLARANISLADTKNPQNKREITSSDAGYFEFNHVAK